MTQLIAQLFDHCKHHSLVAKSWLAMAVGYAITVDRIIKSREVAYMNALIQSMGSEPELALIKDKILKHHQPSLDKVPVLDQRTTELLLKCIIQICAVDRQIQYEEFQYIQKIGLALGLSSDELHHHMSQHVESDAQRAYFDQLISKTAP